MTNRLLRSLRRIPRDDAGMGMILVIGISTVVMLLIVAAVASSTAALRFSTQHVNYEQAIHVAEHGIDQTFAELQADRAFTTTTETPPTGQTPEQEKEWARTRLDAAPVQHEPQGDFAVVKPTGRNVVYAAGWVPSRADARHTRMIKVEYLFSTFNPTHAILVGGNLDISGNPTLTGTGASVHTNGDFDKISGNPTIAGDATSSGSYQVTGHPSIGGTAGGSFPPEEMPRIEPAEMYTQLSTQYAAAWYDLCPDKSVRQPASAPCTGTVLAADASSTPYKGWKFSGNTWDKDSSAIAGTFYIHEGSAKISGNPGDPGAPWRASIIAAGKPVGSGCEQAFGDIEVAGNPYAVPFIPGVMLVAGRDLKVNGNPSQNFEGLFAAGEQIEVSGNPNLNGAVVAQDRCSTPGSPVDLNAFKGNMTLTYNPNLEVPVDIQLRTTLWLEP